MVIVRYHWNPQDETIAVVLFLLEPLSADIPFLAAHIEYTIPSRSRDSLLVSDTRHSFDFLPTFQMCYL